MYYKVREPILYTGLERESVLLNLESGGYFSVNSVGDRVLSILMKRPSTVEELTYEITLEYAISRESAERDIQGFVQDLVEQGLLETVDGRDGS
ncbi:PqqD family protein [Mesorhizobium delmotii]|nr:PqqD family protein [Mesorhizobium delmotii]